MDNTSKNGDGAITKTPSEVVRVEHHNEMVPMNHSIGVSGFDELPTSIIPIGYYRLVQSGSKGVMLESGLKAEPGKIYTDIGEDVDNVRIAILRTKMGKHKVKKEGREIEESIIQLLAIDTKTLTPFKMNITKGGFSNIGRLMMEFKKKGITKSYLYPVLLTSDFIQTKDYEYYAPAFSIESEKFDTEEMEIMAQAFVEYAGSLDKENIDDDEAAPVIPKREIKWNPDGSAKTDSKGNDLTDLPGTGDNEDLPF